MSGDNTLNRNTNGRPHSEAAVVVSGGDGTLFHLLTGLGLPLPPVVILPGGRGNALAQHLRDVGGRVQADLMEVSVTPATGAPYVCLCASSVSFGYPSVVTELAARLRPLRRYCYAAASALTLPRHNRYTIRYGSGAFETRSLTGILINNTRYVGGFVGFPRARLDDGLVEAMELRSGWLSQMAHHLSSMSRLDLWQPAALKQVRSATLRPAAPALLMLDGELLPDIAEISLRVLPAALCCCTLNPGERRSPPAVR